MTATKAPVDGRRAHLAAETADSLPVRRIARLFSPYRKWVVALVVVAAAQAVASIVSPFLLREIIDRALPERSASLVSWLAAGMLVAAGLTAVLGVGSTWLANLIGQRVMHDLRVDVYTHLQRMSLRFFTRTRAGELQSRIANDIGGVDNVVTNTASSTVQNVFAAAAVGVAALIMDWKLACVCLIVIPVFLLFSMRLGRKRRGIARGRQRRLAGLTGLVEESLSVAGVLLTKTMGRQPALAERFAEESRALSETEMNAAMSGRWILSTRRASLTMIPAIVYWIAGMALAHGAAPISIGTAVAFTSMLNRLVGPATALQTIGVQFSTSIALFARIFEVLDLPVDVAESPTARTLTPVRGEVRLDNVSFRYDPDGDWTLRGIDLHVPAGTTTALVGETGSGKTTLAYLVARLYDVDDGAVRIDGVDVRELTLATVSDAVGLVAQETYLFHETVMANLRFARAEASEDDVIAATRAASIHDLIAGLPDGYDTIVGARGYRFSGGERQRLAIARMLLRNPRILLPGTARRSRSRTGSRRSATQTRSRCSTQAASSNAARTTSSSRGAGATRRWPATSSRPEGHERRTEQPDIAAAGARANRDRRALRRRRILDRQFGTDPSGPGRDVKPGRPARRQADLDAARAAGQIQVAVDGTEGRGARARPAAHVAVHGGDLQVAAATPRRQRPVDLAEGCVTGAGPDCDRTRDVAHPRGAAAVAQSQVTVDVVEGDRR
jgi:ATP-binding cassette, subfamily B, bacterial